MCNDRNDVSYNRVLCKQQSQTVYICTVKKLITSRRRLQATGATVGTTELRTMFNNLFKQQYNMASIIATSINLNAIPKDKIIIGKKGKYLPITITLKR